MARGSLFLFRQERRLVVVDGSMVLKLDLEVKLIALKLVGDQRIYSNLWLDFYDTSSLVAKINTVRLFLAIVAICHWPLHQLDIKSVFLDGDPKEKIYMEQPPRSVA